MTSRKKTRLSDMLVQNYGGHRGCDHMVVAFTTTCAISAYQHWSCEFESHSWRGVLDTTLCDKVCQWLATGRWFSLGTPVSSTKKNWPSWYNWNVVENGVSFLYKHIEFKVLILISGRGYRRMAVKQGEG